MTGDQWSAAIRRGRRITVLSLVACLPLPTRSWAQTRWVGWSAYWENDTFVPKRYSSDARYTNGVRFTLTRDQELLWGWAEDLQGWMYNNIVNPTKSYTTDAMIVLGQGMFTPSLITEFEPNPYDRPFSGYLYAGARMELTRDPPGDALGPFHIRTQHALESEVGVLGPPALAEVTQKAVHALRNSRIPKGWPHQLGTEPTLQTAYLFRLNARVWIFDILPHVGLSAGTVQTYGNAGATLRVGNVSAFPTLQIPFTVSQLAQKPIELAVLAGIEWRGYVHNVYVDGGLLHDDDLLIESKHLVREWRLGVQSKLGNWFLNYSFIHRDPEFDTPPELGEGDGDHSYGSISIGRALVGTRSSLDQTNWLKKDWLADLSIGRATSWERNGDRYGPSRTGLAMRLAGMKGLTEKLLLGAELAAAVREGTEPDAQGYHHDTFLTSVGGVFAWRPWGRSRMALLRFGFGQGAVVVQRLRLEEKEEIRRDTGVSVTLGASYGLQLSQRASLALDVHWADLAVGSLAGNAFAYLAWSLGFKWHP